MTSAGLLRASAKLSRPIRTWDGTTPADADVLELIARAGTDVAPPADGKAVRETAGEDRQRQKRWSNRRCRRR